ncbi:multidrug efflux system membrane fusion protein [Granulicella aggregans]|uniref:Multidrug efflux system membrane fusion protein n=1 Tax=Granulicella aggregans TaxID=474949 RepID=A0A7W7ZF48_9BACT|nr:efflux RND transporter periplasmic adaptor subunit [Granulicella aggregans]MBB5058662.1 multidrug efflux system membrane fusion protein [Granulicella aggregans]
MPADPIESHPTPHVGLDHQLPAPPRSRGVRILVWLIILLIFGVAFYLVSTRQTAPKPAGGGRGAGAGGPVTLTSTTAQKGDIGVYLDAIGTVTPVYTASITSQVAGQIVAVHYREGQIVRKGESLIDIDDRSYRATLLQAQGTLEKDQNILGQAKMDLQRYQAAWSRNAIAKQILDDQEKLVLQDEGTVKNDEGLVQYDEVQVGYCHIVSPITGKVGLRLVDPGNVVQANGTTALAVVTQMQPITVVFTIPEDSLGQVQPRLAKGAKLPVDAFDRTSITKLESGSLLTLDNQIDTTTGTVKGRAIYANKTSSLFPNQFVNTRLLVNTLHDATLVPSSAIQHNGSTSFVYVIVSDAKGEKAQEKEVKALVSDGNTTAVQGINPGDVLANSGFDKLAPGATVKIAPNKAAAPEAKGSQAP